VSSDTGFVGLDPDLARDLAREAGAEADTAGHIASEVAGILSVAEVADNGFATMCGEVREELGLLRNLLEAKATEIELAASGVYIPMTAAASAALWESLSDGTGEGVDFAADLNDEDATVTMSSTVAATALATYLGWLGDDDPVDIYKLNEIASNEDLPPEVRAAAQYFLLDDEVRMTVSSKPLWNATREDLEGFVASNAAFAVAAHNYTQWEIAADDDRTPDGEMSPDDLEEVANNPGRYGQDQSDAAQWLIDHGYYGWEQPAGLTWELYSRRIFADDPELAADWLRQATQEPAKYVAGATWYDTQGGREWVNAAVISSPDPAAQAEIVVGFASIYQATQPEPVGPLTILHELLDWVSFVDPTQLADALNAGIYWVEGDSVNAAISAGGILLPLGGGKAIRITREAFEGLAARHGDEAVDALERALKEAAESGGELTDEMIEQIVKDVGDQFGTTFGDEVGGILDDLRRAADDTVSAIEIESIDDVIANPHVLSGRNPAEVAEVIGDTPGWRTETLGRGSHQGQGWVLREYTPDGQPTGRMIRWHPGGGHHGADPYWRVTDFNTRSEPIR